jgi:hypothetical protein
MGDFYSILVESTIGGFRTALERVSIESCGGLRSHHTELKTSGVHIKAITPRDAVGATIQRVCLH